MRGKRLQLAEIGVYGLGTMGSALALNLAEKGFQTAVTNRETGWIAPFVAEAGPLAQNLHPHPTLKEFVAGLALPRVVLLMIPAGAPVDQMIDKLRPLLVNGDMIIDGGNANFNDTQRRSAALQATGLEFVGMGVSGGEDGARNGPSMMVGASDAAWGRLRPMAEAIAAKYQGVPCVARVGPDGAGHFVKTVHNGIEYADMQMISEIYGLLRDGSGWPAARIGEQFGTWNTGALASFLIEASADVLRSVDPETGAPIVDMIVDAAEQKGTGRWTVIEALKLGQSTSAIEAAVGARAWSSARTVRAQAAGILTGPKPDLTLEPSTLEQALLAGRILGHAQGFDILEAASKAHDWALDLGRIAEIWRAGCIIRSALLDDLAKALARGGADAPLILSPTISMLLNANIGGLRRVVASAAQAGLPVPVLSACLAWYDSIRQARGTANLIQAQRDYFGAHGFARIDAEGTFHGSWTSQSEAD